MVKSAAGLDIIENPNGADVFADDCVSFSVTNGTVRITFSATKETVQGGTLAHFIIGRLIMPIGGAQALAIGLYDFLKQNGLDPSVMASGGQTAQ